MRKNNQQKPLARWIAASLAAGAMAGFGAQAVAATAAGTIIKNLATVTYEDANGNKYSAQSNEAFVTVAEVFDAEIVDDKALTAAPGQTVYFPHVLTNNGNATDTYTISTDTLMSGVVIYNDLNSNGQPDPGEPVVAKGATAPTATTAGTPATTGTVTIAAGDQVNLVVAMPIPVTAEKDDIHTADLVVTADSTGNVVDPDGTDATGTVTDTATVTTDPVLVLGKQSVHNAANNTITYTLTVKNNGGSAASNVNILDALPAVDTDGDSTTDAVQVTFDSVSTNGLLVSNGDALGAHVVAYDEGGTDLNDNGVTNDTLEAIVATDITLPPNTTVSVTYTVKYTAGWIAGADIDNTFVATSTETGPVSSNTTHDVLPQYYAVDASDDGTASLATDDNLGADDDGVDDNSQFVNAAPTGAEVLFTHVITNTGNGDDVFNLEISNTNFPDGTIFTFWDSTNTVQITDTNNDGIPDTGTLPPGVGGAETVVIRAKLPAGKDDTTENQTAGYNAVLTATSANSGNDASPDNDSNTTNLKLGSISAAAVDIVTVYTTSTTVKGSQGYAASDGFNVLASDNAQETGPVVVVDGEVGDTVTFDLQLANESGTSDSYLLSADNVPAGWSVVFKDKATQAVITTTPLLAGLSDEPYQYQAIVTISADPALAKSDSDQTGAVDGYFNGTAMAGNDGGTVVAGDTADDDYFIDFIAASTGTPGLQDTVRNAIDVLPMREVVITPDGQNQIQPGGTVDYTHLLENNGNQPETVELDLGNTLEGSGWTTIINIDHDGDDATPMVPLNTLVGKKVGDLVNGTAMIVDVTDTDNDDSYELLLPPGLDLAISTTVNAPSNAPQGAVDVSTILVKDSNDENNTMDSASDQTNVILGQVRLEKKAAIDADCDGDEPQSAFSTNQTTKVEPGQCVTWQLIATNEGNATVKNVVMSDAAPAFTDLLEEFTPGVSALKFCEVNGCDPSTDNVPATTATQATLNTGTGVVTFKPTDGTLISGQTATGQFTVKVQ